MNDILLKVLYQNAACVCVCENALVLSGAINLADAAKLIARLYSPTCNKMGSDTDLPSDLSSLTHARGSIIVNVKI